MYIVVKAGGDLGRGLKAGTADGSHEFVALANQSSLGGELVLRAAEEFLKRLRANQGELEWSDAALEYAGKAGALNVAVDTLRGQMDERGLGAQVFPIVVNDAGLVRELTDYAVDNSDTIDSLANVEQIVGCVLLKLHEKGLLP